MKIIDGILPEQQFKTIQSIILGEGFHWYYGSRKLTGSDPNSDNYLHGWVHSVFNGKWTSPHSSVLGKASLDILKTAGEYPCSIIRIRVIANTIAPAPFDCGVHVDFSFPHHSALLYINETDGDTVFYKNHWNDGEGASPTEPIIESSVGPKPNRVVCFNGLQYHSGTLPVLTPRRVVLVINYKKGEQ